MCVYEGEREYAGRWSTEVDCACYFVYGYRLNRKLLSISGHGELANFNKIKGALAGSKPDQSSKSLWAKMH